MRIYKVKIREIPGRKGWYGSYHIGKQKVIEKFGDTKKEAQLKQADVLVKLNGGNYVVPQNIPFDAMVRRYETHLLAKGTKDKTIYNYLLTLDRFKSICGPLASTQFSSMAIDRFKQVRKQKCELISVNTDLRTMRAFLNWLKSERLITQEIKITMLKTPDTEPAALDDTTISKLMQTAEELGYHDLKLMLQIAISTGLRRSDIQKLAESDIDRKGRSLSATLRKTGVLVKIPISEDLVKAVDNYLFMHVPKDWELIFHAQRLPFLADYPFPDKRWETLRKKAGFGKRGEGWDVDFKSFRSTAFTNMAEQGVPIEVVQALAGHKSITTTMKFYMHVREERLKQAATIPNAKKWFQPAEVTQQPKDDTPSESD